ncbi:MAG TPA: hypothetical protein PKL13_01525 [bacterium]|nr:hypothetical protein [bacterium]
MKNEIIEKLQKALNEEIKEEKQVVFILSKVRKLIELEQKKEKYKYLNFYCNWAFHPYLESLWRVDDILKEFINGTGKKFYKFNTFYKDLKDFFDFFNINSDIFFQKNYILFLNLLIDVYSKTPLIIKDLKKCIIINKSNIKKDGIEFSFSYRIIDEQECEKIIHAL